jgi:heat shock protein HslJ
MRKVLLVVGIVMILLLLVTGCTSQTQSKTVSTPATAAPTMTITPGQTEIVPPVKAPVSDPSLLGTWYLKLMSDQNGTALVQTINPETTVIFEDNINLTGYSGCNNYMGSYVLTEKTNANGKGITIGPLASTKKYCPDGSSTETTYLQILEGATSYLVNENKELSITDNAENTIVYQRTPYSTASVPIGS